MYPPQPGKQARSGNRRRATEGSVRRSIMVYLRSLAPAVYVCGVPGGPFKRGAPDLLLCVRGKFLALELKRPEGPGATELQRESMDAIRRAGGAAEVVRSVEDARAVVERIMA